MHKENSIQLISNIIAKASGKPALPVADIIARCLRNTDSDKLFNITQGLPMPAGIKKEEEDQCAKMEVDDSWDVVMKKEEENSDHEMRTESDMAHMQLCSCIQSIAEVALGGRQLSQGSGGAWRNAGAPMVPHVVKFPQCL